ncbi:MAG: J domain-containing protein [Cyanobacteria bacterium P01_D01_bin.71]
MTNEQPTPNHYDLLKLQPTASVQEIRRAYRDLSKQYHPDTTKLPPAIATEKFRRLNNAYATLSNPESRTAYNYSIGVSRIAVAQAPGYLNRPASERGQSLRNSAYLDPTDRPLSPGEMFALFILGLTFVGCLVLVFTVGWTKGDLVLGSPEAIAPLESASPEPHPNNVQPSSTTVTTAPSLPPTTTAPPLPSLPLKGLSSKII